MRGGEAFHTCAVRGPGALTERIEMALCPLGINVIKTEALPGVLGRPPTVGPEVYPAYVLVPIHLFQSPLFFSGIPITQSVHFLKADSCFFMKIMAILFPLLIFVLETQI